MKAITIDKITFQEIINIHNKLYLPLKKFNSFKDFESICEKKMLPNGKFFPIPIFFSISELQKKRVEKSKKVSIIYKKKKVGWLLNLKFFSINKYKYLKNIYGTNDLSHPGVKIFLKTKKFLIDGKIILNKKVQEKYSNLTLKKKLRKFKKLTGYHTRNIPHKAHEWIIDFGLKKTGAILINPMTGKLRKGDFKKNVVNKAFKILINLKYKNKNNIFFSNLLTYARYAGPREALFHAILRKNLGCTHFLVGRDHAGVGDYYKKYESQRICKKYQKKIGIRILSFREPFFCKHCSKFTNSSCCVYSHKKENKIFVSGTEIRKKILENKKISKKFLDENISKILSRGAIRGFSNN